MFSAICWLGSKQYGAGVIPVLSYRYYCVPYRLDTARLSFSRRDIIEYSLLTASIESDWWIRHHTKRPSSFQKHPAIYAPPLNSPHALRVTEQPLTSCKSPLDVHMQQSMCANPWTSGAIQQMRGDRDAFAGPSPTPFPPKLT